MNYWPALSTNLAETMDPLTAMVSELSMTGARTAREMYGAGGWVTHHNTDLWRATGPIDGPQWGMWPTGGAWLTLPLWDRYEYSGDRGYLQRIYPLLKGASSSSSTRSSRSRRTTGSSRRRRCRPRTRTRSARR